MSERSDAFAILDIHEHRRARTQATPTVSFLIGDTMEEARAVALSWSVERRIPVVQANGDSEAVCTRWLASLFVGSGMRQATLDFLANNLGCTVSEAANRYADDPIKVTDTVASRMSGRGLASVIRRGLGIPESVLLRPVPGMSDGSSIGRVCAASMMYDRKKLPALLLAPLIPDVETTVVAASIAEAAPKVCVIVASTTELLSIASEGRHARDLLKDGTIYVSAGSGQLFLDHAIASAIDVARRARDEARLSKKHSSDEASVDRARSAAERALFEMLNVHPRTRGRFELNGRLAVLFGQRAAEIDLLDRASRIAIEVDGYHHFTDSDHYRRDRRKDALLQIEGYLVLRTLADDVIDRPQEVLSEIVRAIQQRDSRKG